MPTAPGAEPSVALVVEDDRDIRRSVQTALVGSGWVVREAATIAEAERQATSFRLDLIVIDLGLPDGDGVALIRQVRQDGNMPVIVLSARSEEQQKVRALDAGADDYVEKPFRVAEFLARVRAQMRRRPGHDAPAGVVRLNGSLEFDRATRTLRKAGEALHLTPKEYKLFDYLVANAGRVLTQRQLLREVWGPSRVEHIHLLRVFMAALRQKLEDDPSQPTLIITETGVGYRLLVPS